MIQINVKAVPSVSYGKVVVLGKPVDARGQTLLNKLLDNKQFQKVIEVNGVKTYERAERVTFSPAMVEALRAGGVELIISDLSDFVVPKVGQAIDKVRSTSLDLDLSFLA